MLMEEPQVYDRRHGGPYDRGAADAYYRRSFEPHYFVGDTGGSPRILITDENSKEYEEYSAGWKMQMASGDFKDWG